MICCISAPSSTLLATRREDQQGFMVPQTACSLVSPSEPGTCWGIRPSLQLDLHPAPTLVFLNNFTTETTCQRREPRCVFYALPSSIRVSSANLEGFRNLEPTQTAHLHPTGDRLVRTHCIFLPTKCPTHATHPRRNKEHGTHRLTETTLGRSGETPQKNRTNLRCTLVRAYRG